MAENNDQSFEWYRGDTLAFDTEALDYTDPDNPVEIDITDWVLFLTIKKNDAQDTDEGALTAEQADHYDPTHGKSLITAPSTKDLFGKYRYDIRIKSPNGNISTLVSGEIDFHRDAGRRIYA